MQNLLKSELTSIFEVGVDFLVHNAPPSFVHYAAKPTAHGRLTDQTLSQIFYKKTLCDFANLCDDSIDLNKCKGGDLVSQKILESGIGTAWEVAR